MARVQKQGLDYFPFDVVFFDDDKIEFVSAKFGAAGEIITIKLLCRIYSKEGYYCPWTDDESILFAKKSGFDWILVNDVVRELLQRDFFDNEIFKCHRILTSYGIQERFFEACQRRKIVKCNIEYLSECIRVTFNGQNVTLNGKNVTLSTQSKVKESKVKESKEGNPPEKKEPEEILLVVETKEEKDSGQKEESKNEPMGIVGQMTLIHKSYFPDYIAGQYDNQDIKSLMYKLKEYITRKKKEAGSLVNSRITDTEVLETFEMFLVSMPSFWKQQGGSLSTLNSKFNNIIAQIKENGNKQSAISGKDKSGVSIDDIINAQYGN